MKVKMKEKRREESKRGRAQVKNKKAGRQGERRERAERRKKKKEKSVLDGESNPRKTGIVERSCNHSTISGLKEREKQQNLFLGNIGLGEKKDRPKMCVLVFG